MNGYNRTATLKRICCVAALFIGLTLMGCSSSNVADQASTEETTEPVTSFEVSTPEDQMNLAMGQIADEMRVFDVGDHHDLLFAQIVEQSSGLSEDDTKTVISDVVALYMDAYFKERIGEVLTLYNENYAVSDVETIFSSTSRAALYELIELYEWTFYKNNQ